MTRNCQYFFREEQTFMNYQDLFEKFNTGGQLRLPGATVSFSDIPWSKHPTFDGVELKHIVTAKETEGQFSYCGRLLQ